MPLMVAPMTARMRGRVARRRATGRAAARAAPPGRPTARRRTGCAARSSGRASGCPASSRSRPVTSSSSRTEREYSASIIAPDRGRLRRRRRGPRTAGTCRDPPSPATAPRCRGPRRRTASAGTGPRGAPRPRARRAPVNGLERRAQAVPAGQVRACLGPGEHPRDRPQGRDAVVRRRRWSRDRSRPRPAAAEGRDPRPSPAIRSIGVAARKNAANPGRSTQRPVGRPRDRGQLGHRRASRAPRPRPSLARAPGVEASSVAAVTCSRCRWAIVASA